MKLTEQIYFRWFDYAPKMPIKNKFLEETNKEVWELSRSFIYFKKEEFYPQNFHPRIFFLDYLVSLKL